jgi:hypothetical protein
MAALPGQDHDLNSSLHHREWPELRGSIFGFTWSWLVESTVRSDFAANVVLFS